MRKCSLALLFICVAFGSQAQETRKKVQSGNQAYANGKFDEAEIDYREALKSAQGNEKGIGQYNLGGALYQQARYDEALEAYQASLASTENDAIKAKIYHNIGKTLVDAEKLEEAIAAFKQSLLHNSADEETRYNLAKALAQKKQEERQQEKDKDKKDEKKDEKDQSKDQKDQEENKDQSPEDQEDKPEENQEQKPGDPDEANKKDLNRQNIERLLEALSREEEKIQSKVLRQKMKSRPNRSLKDW
jgi:Ca-activated chloride channel family protein